MQITLGPRRWCWEPPPPTRCPTSCHLDSPRSEPILLSNDRQPLNTPGRLRVRQSVPISAATAQRPRPSRLLFVSPGLPFRRPDVSHLLAAPEALPDLRQRLHAHDSSSETRPRASACGNRVPRPLQPRAETTKGPTAGAPTDRPGPSGAETEGGRCGWGVGLSASARGPAQVWSGKERGSSRTQL